MRIKLYQCLCETNRMNKQSYLYNELVLDGNSKTPINKMNPSFVIQDIPVDIELQDSDNNDVVIGDDVSIAISFTGQVYNYMYVEDWDRYYFIEPITFTNNKMYIVNGTLDTLMSFKNKEWNTKPLYITRRTKGNPFIADNLIQFKYQKKIVTNNGETIRDDESVSKGYNSFGMVYNTPSSYLNSYCVVIAVTSSDVYNAYFKQFTPSMRENGNGKMKSFSPSSSFSYMNTIYYVITPKMFSKLAEWLYLNSGAISSILSVTILPYFVKNTNTTLNQGSYHSVMIFDDSHSYNFERQGGFGSHSLKLAVYGNNDRFLYRTIDIPTATSYRDYEPYTEAYMYIPYADTIKLNLQSVRGCTLRLYYYVDFNTSNSSYVLYNVTRDLIESTGNCQLGYKVNLTSSNSEEIRKTQENNLTSFIFSAMSGGLALASGNPMGLVNMGRSMINSLGQSIVRENSLIPKANASATSSNTGSMLPLEPYITWNISEMTMGEGAYADYVKNIGLPYNNYDYIFYIDDGEHVVVGDTSDVIMSSDVTSQELETFKNALANGFYK